MAFLVLKARFVAPSSPCMPLARIYGSKMCILAYAPPTNPSCMSKLM